MRTFVVILICFLFFGTSDTKPRTRRDIRKAKIQPVVLIPGNGGSQIEVSIDREPGSSGIPGCEDKRDWFRLWMNVFELFPDHVTCWASYIKLEYNETTQTSHTPPGVFTRIPGFGNTRTVEFIDPSWTAWSLGNVGSYFAPFVKELLRLGYERETSLRGAPYDFRFAPHSMQNYYLDLKRLIEETYAINGDKRVVLISHSQGGLVTLYFLRQQTEEWKDKFVHAFMSVNTPWAGSAIMLNLFTSGYTTGVSKLDPLIIREQQRSAESGALLLPKAPAYSSNETLIYTPYMNYSIETYHDWFDDIGFSVGKEMLDHVETDDYTLEHPNVDMYCWHGSGIPTPDSIVYDERFPNASPIKINRVEGDSTVSRKSLRACQGFMNNPKYVNSLREFKGGEHLHIFSDKSFHAQVKRVLNGKHGALKKETDFTERKKLRFFSFIWN